MFRIFLKFFKESQCYRMNFVTNLILSMSNKKFYATLLTKIQVQPSYSLFFQDPDSAQTMDLRKLSAPFSQKLPKLDL